MDINNAEHSRKTETNGGQNYMKKMTRNKLVGTLMIVTMISVIGAAIVNAETEETNENAIPKGWSGRMMQQRMPFFSELTDEQQQELNTLREELQTNDATPDEIQQAITEKLSEYGIDMPTTEERLDQQIEQTEQQLEMLKRQKELLGEGYSWEEIRDIIQEEFDLQQPQMKQGCEMGFRGGHRNEFRHSPFAEIPESELESDV